MEEGFKGVGTYITRRKNISAQYIATQPILDLCERSDQRTGVRVSRKWWEQDGLDLEGGEEEGSGSGVIG